MEEPHKETIKNALVKPVEPKIEEVILSYNFQKSSTDNVAALTDVYNKEELRSTVAYILVNYKDTHPIIIQKLKANANKNK